MDTLVFGLRSSIGNSLLHPRLRLRSQTSVLTLAFAIFTNPTATLLVRKNADAAYEEPTQSALKKAKKNAEGLEKKRKKAQELAEREAKEQAAARERREKKLEESKKIVLTQDPSLPAAVKVRTFDHVLLACSH